MLSASAVKEYDLRKSIEMLTRIQLKLDVLTPPKVSTVVSPKRGAGIDPSKTLALKKKAIMGRADKLLTQLEALKARVIPNDTPSASQLAQNKQSAPYSSSS